MENPTKQGEALFAEGKIEEAEKCFLDLLENDPMNAETLNNLGVIQHAKGNVKGAEDLFLKAIAAKEEYLDALIAACVQYHSDLIEGFVSWNMKHFENKLNMDVYTPLTLLRKLDADLF